MKTFSANITVDIQSNGDGTYDTYIADECCSGAHYPKVDAETIGKHVADLIDALEESQSGKSYLLNQTKQKGGNT